MPPDEATALAATRTATDLARLRILVVEDHAESASALATLLGLLGHRVTVAGSVEEALAAATQGFDVAVCDINLPDGTGWDLMRELTWRFGLPGVALSAWRRAADKQRSAAAGFMKHLEKPVSMEALARILADIAPTAVAAVPAIRTPGGNGQ